MYKLDLEKAEEPWKEGLQSVLCGEVQLQSL